MDKRIIWFALIVILVVAAIFIFRSRNKPVATVTTGLVITPEYSVPDKIQVGDSVHYEDHTDGATSWYWDFSDWAGGTSTKQSGYTTYYTIGTFVVKLVINDSIMESTYVEVRAKGHDASGPSKLPPKIRYPKTAYIGEPVTFTDITSGAEHTNWQNLTTAEIKRDSKTYITTFTRKGDFKIVATNEKNTGQGIVTVKVVDKPQPSPQPAPKPSPANKDKPITPPPPPIVKNHPSDAELKKLFNYIATGKEEFTAKYKPIKDAIGDETVPVIIKGATNTQKKLYGFCYYLNMSNPAVLDVQSDWDVANGFKAITVTVKDNN